MLEFRRKRGLIAAGITLVVGFSLMGVAMALDIPSQDMFRIATIPAALLAAILFGYKDHGPEPKDYEDAL